MMIEIKKIKCRGEGEAVEIHYTDNGIDHTVRDPKALADAAFYQAMDALSLDVIKICEFPTKFQESITPYAVHFSKSKEIESVIISSLRKLKSSRAPMVINTPSHALSESEPGSNPFVLPEAAVERLNIIRVEAVKFIQGDRAQKNLFSQK